MVSFTKGNSLSFGKAPSFASRLFVLFLGLIILFFTILISASLGGLDISILSIFSGGLGEVEESVLYSIRIPRIVTATVVGAALACSGATMQALFRNPLADPSIIGISAGSALMVAISIVLGVGFTGFLSIYSLSIAAFLGAVLATFLVFRISTFGGKSSVTYMLLAGIAINAIAAAGTGFLAFLSSDQQLRTLTFWTMGSFSGSIWSATIVSSTIIIPAVIFLYYLSRQLNILILGEDEAKHLGVNTDRLKKQIVILVALIVGAGVAVSGIIGFVGLIVPHLLRLVYGSDNRFIIPASAIFGAILVIISDTVARTVVAPAEIPVGIITSLIGGPYFLYLLTRQKRKFY